MKGSVTDTKTPQKGNIARWAAKQAIYALLLGVVLFLSSGHLDWVEAWLYFALVLLIGITSAIVLVPRSPDLLAERSRMKEGTKSWDKGLSLCMAFSPIFMTATAGLERRFEGMHPIAVAIVVIGTFAAIAGSLFTLWAMMANRFFSGVVRIQGERGHTAVSAGPYQYVRHPGYLGALVFTLATPFILGSSWAFIAVALTVIVTIVRTRLEDHTLQRELTGYSAYATIVRFRLLPGLW